MPVPPERRRIARAVACVAALALTGAACRDARAAEEDAQMWTGISARIPVSDRVSAGLAAQLRLSDDVSKVERWVVTPSLSLAIAPWLAASLGYDAHLIEHPVDTLEQRVWQQAALRHGLGDLAAELRLRVEERLFEPIDGVAVRTRVRVRVRHPVGIRGWYLAASDEVFTNANSLAGGPRRGFDQNRLFAGFGRTLGGGVRAEIGYQWQHVHRPGPAEDFDAHTLMVGLSYAPP